LIGLDPGGRLATAQIRRCIRGRRITVRDVLITYLRLRCMVDVGPKK
jgi:hypothetical protein